MSVSPREQLARLGITLAEAEADEPEVERPRFTEVEPGPEFLRIRELERRAHPDPESDDAQALADYIFDGLALGPNPYPGRPRPIQALALDEAVQCRGAFMMLRVGAGKTWVAAMLPVLIQTERPLYICPKKMCGPVATEFERFRSGWVDPKSGVEYDGWHGILEPHAYPIVSYEKLSSKKSGEELADEDDPFLGIAKGDVKRLSYLEMLAPTLIVLDESHLCASTGAAVTKRIDAYLEKYPDTIVVAMTGTPFKTSIEDAVHVMEWCLRERTPLPLEYEEREMWASYLNARGGMGPRCSVGALSEFLTAEQQRLFDETTFDEEQRSLVRQSVARWILETPGVIGTQDPPLDTLLTVEEYGPGETYPELDEALAEFRHTWVLPDGTECADGLEFNRHMNTLAQGFFNKWDPDPGSEYRAARNAWAKWCRKMLRYNKRGIDSEARMKQAVRKGFYDDEGLLDAWEAEEARYRSEHPGLLEPPSVPVWVSSECIDAVRAWLAAGHQGVIWVNYIGMGERLSAELGIPYYAKLGLDKRTGRFIEQHSGGPAVASIGSNGTGKNLQRLWWENLWLCMPGEQSLGRTHRAGQPSPVVRNWIYVGCFEHLKGYFAAKSTKAKFAEEMTLSPQKLRYAQTSMPSTAELAERGYDEEWSRWVDRKGGDSDGDGRSD